MYKADAIELGPAVFTYNPDEYLCKSMYDTGEIVYFPQHYHEPTDELIGVVYTRGKVFSGKRNYGVYFFGRTRLLGTTPRADFRPISTGNLMMAIRRGDFE